MVITYHGENYVKAAAGSLVFLVDPTDERSFRSAKFVLFTESPPPLMKGEGTENLLARREPLLIADAGEYEVEGVRIAGYRTGIRGETSHLAYRVTMENLSLVFLGHLTELPDQKTASEFADADILFVPGGGAPWLKETDAAKLVRQLEPGIIIPTLVGNRACERFVKELDAQPGAPTDKLTLKKKDVVPKAMAVTCLTA